MENATYIARTSGIGTRDKIGYMMGATKRSSPRK